MLVARGARELPVVGVALDDVLCGAEHPPPKVEKLTAPDVELDGHALSSVADESLRSTSSTVRRSSSTSLSRDVWPDTIRTSRAERRSVRASSAVTSSFARPCSGAERTR